ncbi:nucleotidyl transferase AbiEii/AbiGii toxin family protein [Streptomyces sp. FXJ1.172]|uniref:nucleotidyl transferase AbiEii/AbiGii toxin family protein n=1 Tax=Streptomyces sp. FXJ1.172 TaxID=710705 RepID=UPI0007CF6BBF|nr:nucleotidyl transferase AbiEii/AbiGii toxin family protein [Streptomyces sp. FXJ1.172]WEO93009.1 nucleotidyl transferase AbiEii/AbiGii toxin family protein [Streptomyces sp. FXJ1.172]
MYLTHLHRRLLTDVLAIGTHYPLVITGGYAVQAHGLVDRPSQDLEVATENPALMDQIIHTVRAGLTDPATGEDCEVDILTEAFWTPPAATECGPVLALDDVIGTKVRALAERGAVRDLIDVHAASRHRTTSDLEGLGRRHARTEFRLSDLRDRVAGAEWWDDADCTGYGLTPHQISDLRDWALAWANDLDTRLHAEEDPDN